MSTATQRRPHAQAVSDAHDFRSLFDPSCYRRWKVAGSVRRGKLEVGDIEHVIEPVIDGGVNLLWRELERLTRDLDSMFGDPDAPLTRAEYGENRTHRWGEKYRGVAFRGFKHELFTADSDNWGCVLTIRTGPAEYSQMLVTRLHSTALRQRDGYLVYEKGGRRYPCSSEEAFFDACGLAFVPPPDRILSGHICGHS